MVGSGLYNVLEYSVCTSLHLIGQIQVSKSHRDLVKKSRSLYIETYKFTYTLNAQACTCMLGHHQ